jgi:hypothetical protein
MTTKERISGILRRYAVDTNENWRVLHRFFNQQEYSPKLKYWVDEDYDKVVVVNNLTGDRVEIEYF